MKRVAIDYLAIGHICADLQPDGSTRLGGTALFAAQTAHQLGLRAAILTACAPDFDLSAVPAGLQIFRQPSPATTIFENRYGPDGRTQLLHGRAQTIAIDNSADLDDTLPPDVAGAEIVHLAPIIQEVPLNQLQRRFPRALVGATPQGWLRSVDSSGLVTTTPVDLLGLDLARVGAVIFSEEDVQYDEELVRHLAQRHPLVVLTRAERGATVFADGSPTDVPAARADVVDPTGAGDVFAAAFLGALRRGEHPVQAARWACAAAACAIEAPGTLGLPTAAAVQQRLLNY